MSKERVETAVLNTVVTWMMLESSHMTQHLVTVRCAMKAVILSDAMQQVIDTTTVMHPQGA